MAQDPTAIVNMALLRIGSVQIMDIEDPTDVVAIAANTVYEQSIRECGRDAEWNCLSDLEELGQLSAQPDFGYAYRYALPRNFIRMNKFNGEIPPFTQDLFKIHGRTVLSDAAVARCEFNRYVADTSVYDSLFVAAVVVLIAAKLATDLRQDNAKGDALMAEYENVTLPKARKSNGNEHRKQVFDPVRESRWNHSRRFSTIRSSPN